MAGSEDDQGTGGVGKDLKALEGLEESSKIDTSGNVMG